MINLRLKFSSFYIVKSHLIASSNKIHFFFRIKTKRIIAQHFKILITMRLLKSQAFLRLLNSYMVDSPQPANISYLWNFGSLLGACLVLQILTGVFLAMHYTPHVDFAFNSVEHIMRDVNAGYILRYTHANVASFFFIFVYAHIARGLYYSSYRAPRVQLWTIGVIILIVMMATAFLGYVLPYGQMSLWGMPKIAPDIYTLNHNNILIIEECLGSKTVLFWFNNYIFNLYSSALIGFSLSNKEIMKIRAEKRIGAHNIDILSILFGSLLGDCHAEFRSKGKGTRFSFYQESSHTSYLLWLHDLISGLNYCNPEKPQIQTRLGKKGKIRKVIRFKTWTYSSLNWVHDLWYIKGKKIIPKNLNVYLNPLALAIWIMDVGSKSGKGLKLSTNSFSFSDCIYLTEVLFQNFHIKSSVISAGYSDQYVIYIWKESMPLLREIVSPYVHSSMKYKLI